MCPPDYFDIKYSINPWMNTHQHATNQKTVQWQKLKNKFEKLDVKVELLKPQKNLPDMVYVDIGIVYKNNFIPSNFRYKERWGERKFAIDWFKKHGYKIIEIEKDFYFEGHGDTLWAGEKLFFGYGFRSSIEAQKQVEKILKKINPKIEIIPTELIDPRFYHLDTCFCPLNSKQALYFPGAFSPKAKKMLVKNIELIPVSEREAKKFACNAVVVDKNILIPAGANFTYNKLKKLGYKIHPIEMTEFIKGGGACKCLSFVM